MAKYPHANTLFTRMQLRYRVDNNYVVVLIFKPQSGPRHKLSLDLIGS